MPESKDDDPFDKVLELEDTFWKEGYELGLDDGQKSGRIEGRAFGLEKGFEKFRELGQLHGQTLIWASRLSQGSDTPKLPRGLTIPPNPRLEKQLRTLYSLVEPASFSTQNDEDSVSDFDDRLKRAKAKVKIVEKLINERSTLTNSLEGARNGDQGNIEDIGPLPAQTTRKP